MTQLPTRPVENTRIAGPDHRPVYKIDVVQIHAGERLTFEFLGKNSPWRQGVWLGVAGSLKIAGVSGDQFEIWEDTAPKAFTIDVVDTSDGLLRIYNIWDSGRGRRRESHSATSGMIVVRNGSLITYHATDIGSEPTFDRLRFRIDLLSADQGRTSGA